MANAALQDPVVPAALDYISEPHSEHEAGGAESPEHATDTSENDMSADREKEAKNDRDIADACPEISSNIHPRNTKSPLSPTKSKLGLSVKLSQGKTPSGPPTPTVKKIINSGTFGAGAMKTTPRLSVSSSAAMKPATSSAPPLKKSNSTSSAVAASKTSASTSRALSASTRRASLVPAKPAPSTGVKTGVQSAVSKPTSAAAPSGTSRPSVTSPTGSVASLKSSTTSHRPRPSVSEGGKRTAPVSAKPTPGTAIKSAANSTKPATPRTSTISNGTKPSQPSVSITSIHEVKEDPSDEGGMPKKPPVASEELASKLQVVNDLEEQIRQLQSSLSDAKAEVEAKQSFIEELHQEKANVEANYKDQLEDINKQCDETTGAIAAQLAESKENISALQSVVQAKEESIQSLSSQGANLEAQLSEVTKKLESSRSSQQMAAEAGQLAASKMEASIAEIEDLKSVHAQMRDELKSKLKDLERNTSEIGQLETQIAGMKIDLEEHANKVSELEVEILELTESQESVEDQRDKLQARVKELEDQISFLTSTAQQAEEAACAKAVEATSKIADLQSQHMKELQAASEERAKIAANLEAAQSQLDFALRDLELTKKEAVAAAEDHSRKVKEVEVAFTLQKSELEQEIKRLNVELEGEEAKYNSQLGAFKVEHETQVQDAFKRAKIEAGEQHALELQSLRQSSNAMIVQLRDANETSIEELKAEYSATRESEVKSLEKQINALNLELKAAKDDLAKAKAALDGARLEAESLTKQRDDALAVVAAVPSFSEEHIEEKNRLTNELSQVKDDLNAVTDMLNLTKASLSELSVNHAKELEEVAKMRAEEVMKLRAGHDEEITAFANQKMDLSLKISDLEGELATVKALVVEGHASTKSNGVSVPPPDTAGVKKEELQRMHEAHNLKLYDLQAEHDKVVKALQDELRTAQQKAEELHQEVGRKAMEIQYLEQDQEESQEQITRLKEDLEVMGQRQRPEA